MGSIANPNPNPATNTYQIGGVPVEFPYKPYGTQLAFMGRVISTLDRAKRQGGRAHALLESPTGTGKTLSLLCSALAWQRACPSRYPPAAPEPLDPLVHGGGFVPEPDQDQETAGKNPRRQGNANSMRAKRKLIRPTIYYASRTHAQISQVIREYRKTTYRVPMAILASRKHYCTNKDVCNSETIDEECKMLLKDDIAGCPEYKNASKVKAHHSLQKGGCYEAHDIEDLVKVGRMVKGCSYFAAQCMAAEADLVFCPYSYVINPVIRRAMDIDIKEAILILDEAHNIEDMAREAGSIDVDEEALFALQAELARLSLIEELAAIYQPLHDMIGGIIGWVGQRKDNLEKHDFEHYCTCWTGDRAIKELQEASIDQVCFPILKECATKAIRAASDVESLGTCLSGLSALILEGLFSSLCFILSENGRHSFDYQLALQRYVKREAKDASIVWTHTFSLWCLNPAIVFREITDITMSVILSSGTLSPMGSFASELGVQFEACLEAPHVIDVESQLFAAVIATGPNNCELNASYKASAGYAFQDELGASLEEIFKTVPGGILVFFPSYKLLDKLRNRWSQTKQWSKLSDQKSLFVEPRSKDGDFETILKEYYSCIRGTKKSTPGNRKSWKRDSRRQVVDSVADSTKGAAFFAVCRGKVSEGIDFSDDNARAVVIVGIPFPNKTDIQVALKKKYNDRYRSSKALLSGSEWYCHQAFRALNQAAGRCIRHKSDYGAVILMDERFKDDRNLAYISRWIRKPLQKSVSFDASLEGLRTFFLGKNDMLRKCQEETKIPEKKKISGQKARQRYSHRDKEGITNSPTCETLPIPYKSKCETPPWNMEEGLERGCGQLRLAERCSSKTSEHSMLSEATDHFSLIPPMDKNLNSPCNGHHHAVLKQHSPSLPIAYSDDVTVEVSPTSIITTPAKNTNGGLTSEQRLFSSVDSCYGKRKKLTDCQINGLAQKYNINSPGTESCCRVDLVSDNTLPNSFKRSDIIIIENSSDSSEGNHMKLDKEIIACTKYISCKTCRTDLGINPTPCTLTSSSKVCLSTLRNDNARPHILKSDSYSKQSNVPVVICDASYFNLLLTCKASQENMKDIWNETDGCVFRIIKCPYCIEEVCMGLQILAADALNTHLIDKVFFYADRVHLRDGEPVKKATLPTYKYQEPVKKPIPFEDFDRVHLRNGEPVKKATLPTYKYQEPVKKPIPFEDLDRVHLRDGEPVKKATLPTHKYQEPIKKPIPFEDFAYTPKADGVASLVKSKLRLPKRDLCSPR